jgi:hypothetical protein
MKKLRLLALLVVLIAVVANGSPHRWIETSFLCGSYMDPTLCEGSTDIGCDNFCPGTAGCDGFSNIHGTCTFNGTCRCTANL